MGHRVQQRSSSMRPLAAGPILLAALFLTGCGKAPAAAGDATAEQAAVTQSTAEQPTAEQSTAEPLASATADGPDVIAECEHRSATGASVDMSDTGFGLATVTFAPEPHNLCFFDGRSWWSVDLVNAPIRAAQVTGVGWFPSQIADQEGESGRLVFGMADTAVTEITVTVDGNPAPVLSGPGRSAAFPGLPILAYVPATGTVVVTATGSGGVLQQVRARTP